MELGSFSDLYAPVDNGLIFDRPCANDALVPRRRLCGEPDTESPGIKGYGEVDVVLVGLYDMFDVGNPVTL